MRRALLVGLVILLVAGAAVGTAYVTRADQEDIFLEGAGSVGPNPFTMAAAVAPVTTTTVAGDPTTTVLPDATTTTALFGGSGNQKVCDPESLIVFLESHPDKGGAWIQALNSDPTFRWSKGTQLAFADIRPYILELTPTFLIADTRVTNHGYKNGKATPRQSVLQKGTAVLVDRDGVPRVRCACGNPLLPPKKVRHPHYDGPCWETTTTTRRPRPTTTTTIRPRPTTTTTLQGETTTTGLTPGQPIGLGRSELTLIWARPSNKCGDEPYCSPPGCSEATTTTVPETTTTVEETTTTCVPGIVGGVGCTTQTTRRRGSVGTTGTTGPPTATTNAATTTPPTTPRTTQAPPRTTQQTTAPTAPPQTGKP